ncbi:ornithine cyclodeaminase family protein [Kribbella antibiotica]|uniref:ornithine cyclodeaminase family protein n=1 Tax=Kribbella antibiotica TaxID=190195 RepID=UPI001404A171|nr:ornithine cyclodeaminase family protein [Kribbella antibiotica]
MIRQFSGDDVLAVPATRVVEAIKRAAEDPRTLQRSAARSAFGAPGGEMLLMPAADDRLTGVKLATIAPGNPANGLPRVQGVYVLFDSTTLTPVAVIDAVELTAVRTAGVSMVGIAALGGAQGRTAIVGTSVQARAHLRLLVELGWCNDFTVHGRRTEAVEELAAYAKSLGAQATPGTTDDLRTAKQVICCTSASTPVVPDTLAHDVIAVAVGSHTPTAAELPAGLFKDAQVVVESQTAATTEAGDVILAVAAGTLPADAPVELGSVLRGEVKIDPTKRRIFKSVGMAWQDLAVATAVFESDISERG